MVELARILEECWRLADLGCGHVEPNPRVGAVALAGDEVVGRGYHAFYGGAHAEVAALEDAAQRGRRPDGMVVSLEPCSTQGKTPPCVEAIVRAGIRRIVVGAVDPNPVHRGRGLARLRDAGVRVELLEGDQRFAAQNRPFLAALERPRPWVVGKWAMTLDGRMALSTGDSKWVSSEPSRLRVHDLRGRCEGVAVGVRTVLADDPLLTCRTKLTLQKPPARIVFDSELRTPVTAQLLRLPEAPVWILTAPGALPERRHALERAGAQILEIPADGQTGRVNLAAALAILGSRGVRRLLVEGGPELLGALRDRGLLDQVLVFVAPKIAGGAVPAGSPAGPPEAPVMSAASALSEVSVERLEDDVVVSGFLGISGP